MLEFDDAFLNSHSKLGFKFPVKMGDFVCETLENARKVKEDLLARHLPYFQYKKKDYDPLRKIKAYKARKLNHVLDMEEYWIDCEDKNEVRRRRYQRLTLQQL